MNSVVDNSAMKINKSKSFVTLTVALLASSFIFPLPASAAPRDLGEIAVDCDEGFLGGETIDYFSIGDTFTIANAEYQSCLILDPNNILTGEDADHSGIGPGYLDYQGTTTTSAITIDGPGTFTITENGGGGAVVTFTVRENPYFDFSNEFDVGVDPQVGDTFLYEGVTVIVGTTIDATVTITRLVNLEETPILDEGSDVRIRTSIDAVEDMDGFIEYTVDFHADGDPTSPVAITDLTLTVKDIDSLQYVAAEDVDSFNLSSSPRTKLTPRASGHLLFIEELNDIESSSSDQDHWAVLNFDSTSTVNLRLGSRAGGASFGVVFSTGSTARDEFSIQPADVAPDSIGASSSAPATTTTPTLATTGANVEWLMIAGLLAAIAGVSFLTVSRRKRTA
jgi:LPXTG-motif cell wall-anchored protein